MTPKRSAFFVSDRTGITAEVVGHSLLTQFDELEFNETTLPFIDTPEKVVEAVEEINQAARRDGVRPIVISTLVGEAMSALLEAQDLRKHYDMRRGWWGLFGRRGGRGSGRRECRYSAARSSRRENQGSIRRFLPEHAGPAPCPGDGRSHHRRFPGRMPAATHSAPPVAWNAR
jgi:hypothetical protein